LCIGDPAVTAQNICSLILLLWNEPRLWSERSTRAAPLDVVNDPEPAVLLRIVEVIVQIQNIAHAWQELDIELQLAIHYGFCGFEMYRDAWDNT